MKSAEVSRNTALLLFQHVFVSVYSSLSPSAQSTNSALMSSARSRRRRRRVFPFSSRFYSTLHNQWVDESVAYKENIKWEGSRICTSKKWRSGCACAGETHVHFSSWLLTQQYCAYAPWKLAGVTSLPTVQIYLQNNCFYIINGLFK